MTDVTTYGQPVGFARQTADISLLLDPDALRARLDRPFDVDELTAGLKNETYLVAHPRRGGSG